MAFFDSFTDSIKQKWLQFFQANRDWIILHTEVESVYTPDGGKRPSSYLILGVVNALEPKLAQLMLPFSKLNPDADTLIEVLDLHFDPDIILGNRVIPKVEPEATNQFESDVVDETPANAELAANDLNATQNYGHSFEEINVSEFPQDLGVSEPQKTEDKLDEFSLSDGNGFSLPDEPEQSLSLDTGDEFGDISFDSVNVTESNVEEKAFDDLNPPDEKAFSDVLSDVWGDASSLQKGEENNELLGEELPLGVFDDSEIARLFPNT
jgi:hypothetical protein